MAQKTEPLAHADELADLWRNLLRYHRRALLVLAYVDPDPASTTDWLDLPTDTRMRLVRAMRGLTELAVDCAVTLERAKQALEAVNGGH
jgi:hypothetical protein